MNNLRNFLKRTFSAFIASLVIVASQLAPIFSLIKPSVVHAADTGLKTPTAAHTPNGFDVSTVASVQASDDVYVTDDDGDEQGYSNFDFAAIPPVNVINGIEVIVEAKSTDTGNDCQVRVSLSWNDGANYTSPIDATIDDTEGSDTLGGSSNTWGRTWAVGDFTNANFVLRIQDRDPGLSCSNTATTSVDQIQVKVYYATPADLVVVKSNDAGGVVYTGNTFTWTLTVTNNGGTAASFNSVDILRDSLPTNASYSPTSNIPVVTSGVSGDSIDCDITGILADNLVCDDNLLGGAVVIDAGGWFSVSITVTPDGVGSIDNPRVGPLAMCRVDPSTVVSESDETNNDCSDSVMVGNQPKITVIKNVVNAFGGTKTASDFTINVSGTNVSEPTFPGSETGMEIILDVGSYEVTEVNDPGYEASYSDDCSGDIALNEELTCTITNTAIQPKLVVTKSVVNDNGGDAVASDFTMTVSGTNVSDSEFPGDEAGTEVTLSVGSYTVSEVEFDGYTMSLGSDCSGDIALGETKYCTVTNDDIAPTLTLVKNVINDNYGSIATAEDWTLTATPEDDSEDTLSGNGLEGFMDIPALAHQTYTLSESGPSGYTASEWDCSSTSGVFSHPDGNGTIRMSEGAVVRCEITNDDNEPTPSIRVEKSGPDTAHEGEVVTYIFDVYNTGNIALDYPTVVDDVAGEATYSSGDSNEDGILDLDEVWTFSVDYTIPEGQDENVVNTVIACANEYEEEIDKFALLSVILSDYDTCDEDSHELDVLHPQIKIVKSGPSSAKAGDTVQYTFVVTNPGDVELEEITVTDSILGAATYLSGDTDSDNRLDVDETWTYFGNYTIPANQTGSVVNTAVASGYEVLPEEEVQPLAFFSLLALPIQVQTTSSDSHTLLISVTNVLGLVNTGESAMYLYAVLAIGLIGVTLVSSRLPVKKR